MAGFIHHWNNKQQDWIIKSMAIVWILSILLALGASSSFTLPLFEWLWNHWFIFRGFRDSHKFVGLILLAYAYLGGLEVTRLFIKGKELRNTFIKTIILAYYAQKIIHQNQLQLRSESCCKIKINIQNIKSKPVMLRKKNLIGDYKR